MKPIAKRTGPNDWQTPKEILDRVRKLGPIGFDPCTVKSNPTGARLYATMDFPVGRGLPLYDGLALDWLTLILKREELIFVNPPFGCRVGERHSQVYEWVPPAMAAARAGIPVVFLSTMSQRIEIARFQKLFDVDHLDAFWFPTGRVSYVDPRTGEQAKGTGSWPTMMMFYNLKPNRVLEAFGDRGVVIPVGQFDGVLQL